MKRVLLMIGMIAFSLSTFSQEITIEKRLEDIAIKNPKYNESVLEKNDEANSFSELLGQMLVSFEEKSSIEFREGTVVVDFTVNTDGTIENFKIQNSVAASNDKAVISALKRTSGDWIPGSQNGNPIAMEKRLLVAFNDLNTQSLQESAKYFCNKGVKQYLMSQCLDHNPYLSAEKREVKMNRKLKFALTNLNIASRYVPNEPSILQWQACVYDKLGDEVMRDEKLMELGQLAGNDFPGGSYAVVVTIH